jgi:hypothetical protein
LSLQDPNSPQVLATFQTELQAAMTVNHVDALGIRAEIWRAGRRPVRDLFGELIVQSGNVTQEFTHLRGPGLIPESCGFPAIFARIYAAGLECPRESAVPAGVR